MSFSVVTVKFSSDKTCFVSLSKNESTTSDIQVFEVESYDSGGGKFFVSWSGELVRGEHGTDGVLQINGLFAAKLSLKDGDQVILRHHKSVPNCTQVYVEPLSIDDWEIFDRHSAFIESGLLDQLRVIQNGKVYPVWVEKSVCIFIKIGSMTPQSECALLVNETEVIVTPKVKSPPIGQPMAEEPISQKVTENLEVPFIPTYSPDIDEESFDTRFTSTDSEKSIKDFPDSGKLIERKIREKSPYDPVISTISNHWNSLFSMLGFRSRYNQTKVPVSEDEDYYCDEDDSVDHLEHFLQNGLNLVLRVQYLKFTPNENDYKDSDFLDSPSSPGSLSPRKSGSISPRKGSRESPSKYRNNSIGRSKFRVRCFPLQPSTVYLDISDIEKQAKINRSDIPPVFYAKVHKLSSPKEQNQERLNTSSGSGKVSPRKESKNGEKKKVSPSDSINSADFSDQTGPDTDQLCIVRVVVFDRRRQLCSDQYAPVIKRILSEQPLLLGHVIVPDMLRRYLKLDVTSRVWLQTWNGPPKRTNGFSLYPLGNIPKNLTNDKVTLAFREWLDQVSNEDYPIVIYQGLFVRFEVYKNVFIDAQVVFDDSDHYHKPSHTLLHPGCLRHACLTVVSGGRGSDHTHNAIQPMLAYLSVASIDPYVPNMTPNMVGGMKDLLLEALSTLEICLGSRPLHKEVFLTTPGLLNGMLLLTGPKGSGKTTLARILCRQVAELPNLAYTTIIECKPLRGKKVDTIQKIFELIFDEAAWRQPALIVLEDLDHLAGAPAGPEFEMSGEALYAARVAEVVKDLLRKDIRNMSSVAVLATCQARASLNPILTSSRGVHLVQEVLYIMPPDQNQRKEMIQTIMEVKHAIHPSVIECLDLDQLALKTQGYVARDLETVTNRAIHAHILTQGRAVQSETELLLTQDDFYRAIDGFTPASIRNVPLHSAGELTWEDIGGLTDVKETLVETLQWPTKYPTLFASCPLRLRSGLLLYGAPGTGKTLLAGVVARECGLNFISIKGPELLSKYIGASEQAVRDTFVRAQSAKPCILFFDEFDSMAPRRGHDNTGVTDRVVNQLLTQLDGVEGLEGVYVLAATSRPDLIDPALLRPGRLDKALHCKLPNQEERLSILRALSCKMRLADDIDFKHFAKECLDFTGADFKALLYNAQLEAIHEITSQDAGGGSLGRFGMKSRTAGINKLRNNRPSQKLSPDDKSDRPRSFSAGTYAYIPSLEKGIVQVSMEMEEKLSSQVNQIRLRERRSSEHIPADDQPDSPYGAGKMIMVYHKHLLSAASKLRPSVSGDERLKYQRIYENFTKSRGGNFDMGFLEGQTMKATLA